VGKPFFSKIIFLIRKNNFGDFRQILIFRKRNNNFSLLNSQLSKKYLPLFYQRRFLSTDVKKTTFYEAGC